VGGGGKRISCNKAMIVQRKKEKIIQTLFSGLLSLGVVAVAGCGRQDNQVFLVLGDQG
jgi:hypothetical protein